MGFKLDGEEQEEVQEQASSATGSMADSDGYYHASQTSEQSNPVAAATASKKAIQIPKAIIILVIAVVVALVLTLIPWNKKTALDSYLTFTRPHLEETLGITLTENPEGAALLSIPNQDYTGFLVYSTPKKDMSVIYYDGRQAGICFDGSQYSLYGMKIGDAESHLLIQAEENNILAGDDSAGYKYTKYFCMLEDMEQKGSTAEYFLGVDGSVLVLVVNDTSNRVVNIIYYYNSTRILQDVEAL